MSYRVASKCIINKWNNSNTSNTMYLIRRSNTLKAECDLGGIATVLRVRTDGTRITDPAELAGYSNFGKVGRNSDPANLIETPFSFFFVR